MPGKSCSGNDWQNILPYLLNDGLYRLFNDKGRNQMDGKLFFFAQFENKRETWFKWKESPVLLTLTGSY